MIVDTRLTTALSKTCKPSGLRAVLITQPSTGCHAVHDHLGRDRHWHAEPYRGAGRTGWSNRWSELSRSSLMSGRE